MIISDILALFSINCFVDFNKKRRENKPRLIYSHLLGFVFITRSSPVTM